MIYTINDIEQKLIPICKKFDVKEMYLFGSYAKGNATERSDIDLIVDSNLKGLRFYGLLEDIKEALNKDIDLIEAREIRAGSDFDKEVRRERICVYERKRQGNIA